MPVAKRRLRMTIGSPASVRPRDSIKSKVQSMMKPSSLISAVVGSIFLVLVLFHMLTKYNAHGSAPTVLIQIRTSKNRSHKPLLCKHLVSATTSYMTGAATVSLPPWNHGRAGHLNPGERAP